MVALCAATNIQLNLAPKHSVFDFTGPTDIIDDVYATYTQDYLLSEAIKIRTTLNIAENPDTDTLLTSCFLFSAYANLERHNEAWFYLSHTVSFVISLGLHDESTYSSLDVVDAQIKRGIFWLVFVLERAYSLHLKRPMILPPTIRKPHITFIDDPTSIDSFLASISMFEALPSDYTTG